MGHVRADCAAAFRRQVVPDSPGNVQASAPWAYCRLDDVADHNAGEDMRSSGWLVAMMAACASSLASTAEAQICAGFPTADRQFYVGANLHLPEDANQFGVEAAYNASGPFAIHGGVSWLSADDDTDLTVLTGGAAFDFAFPGSPTRPFFSVCPLVEIDYAKEGDVTFRDIPVGVGVGSSIPIGAGGQNSLMPFIIPAVVFSRVSIDDGDSSSDTNFALRGGAILGFGSFFLGAEVAHVFEDAGDPVFGFRAGLRL
jgi:hypothetical protein